MLVRNIHAGPFEGLTKAELPGQLCVFAREVLRAEAAQPLGHYDAVHSHYWLSGQVGALARDRWGVPLVHSMHTMAKVKNDALAEGDTPEPAARIIGEEQVVEAADMLIANTDTEAKQLINLYDADAGRASRWSTPASTSTVFRPRDRARGPAGGSACPPTRHVLLFAGRIQPLKAPDVLLRAVAVLLERDPDAALAAGGPDRRRPVGLGPRPPRVAGPAGRRRSASTTWCGSCRRSRRPSWPQWYAAADLVAVPSYNESFGLVAVEAQASGTPVVAAAVGGLTTVVDDGRSGLLVDTHEPARLGRRAGRAGRRPGAARAAGARRARQARAVLVGPHRRADPGDLRPGPVVHARGRCLTWLA